MKNSVAEVPRFGFCQRSSQGSSEEGTYWRSIERAPQHYTLNLRCLLAMIQIKIPEYPCQSGLLNSVSFICTSCHWHNSDLQRSLQLLWFFDAPCWWPWRGWRRGWGCSWTRAASGPLAVWRGWRRTDWLWSGCRRRGENKQHIEDSPSALCFDDISRLFKMLLKHWSKRRQWRSGSRRGVKPLQRRTLQHRRRFSLDLQRHVEDLVGVGPPDAPQQLLKVGHKSYSRSWEDINRQRKG